jgi:hypothetical protein
MAPFGIIVHLNGDLDEVVAVPLLRDLQHAPVGGPNQISRLSPLGGAPCGFV